MSIKCASDILHRVAASRDSLLWTPGDNYLQKSRKKRRCQLIEDLVYLILSRKDDVTKPGELNTFLDRLGSGTENDSEVIESGSSEKTTTFYFINPCKHYKNSSF